jgi:predicted DNA-binding protein with PD1-like motif
MNVAESKRVRHLLLHIERGEELPVALIRALHDVEARSAVIHGVGILEAIEVASIDPEGRSRIHRLDTPSVLVSLHGNVAVEDGATNVHLYVTVARQTELGHQTVSGHVRWARASALDLHVTVFDDLVLERLTDDHGFSAALHATSRTGGTTTKVVVEEAPAAPPVVAPPVVAPPVVAAPVAAPPVAVAPVAAAPVAAAPVVPAKPAPRDADLDVKPVLAHPARLHKPHEDATEVYPEVNDLVTHFHFGDCEVIGSDGERIRLRQIKDGRVREVSLAMLKIEGPTVDPETNKRTFRLSRKN